LDAATVPANVIVIPTAEMTMSAARNRARAFSLCRVMCGCVLEGGVWQRPETGGYHTLVSASALSKSNAHAIAINTF
jgi:hypothetical protein